MNEKIYKTMAGSGVLSITVGIIVAVVGLTSGILLIIGGGKLLARKSDLTI